MRVVAKRTLREFWEKRPDAEEAQREGEPLVWEDARRVVFQTLVVMYELDRAVAE